MSNYQLTAAGAVAQADQETLDQTVPMDGGASLVAAAAGKPAPGARVLDEDIAHLIRRAHQRASATFMSVLATQNLTPAQYFALTRLREKGQVSQNLLGRMSAMDPATIQGVVKRLSERGLVARVPDRTDRRRMILHLTSEGEQVIDGLRSGIDAMTGKILAPLSAEEQDQLRALLKRIV